MTYIHSGLPYLRAFLSIDDFIGRKFGGCDFCLENF